MSPRSPTEPPPGYVPPRSAAEVNARYAAGERYFVGAQLRGADLQGARLWEVNLSAADLTEANLSHALIEDSDFSRADLTRTDLFGAKCHGATFKGAILSQTRLPGGVNWNDRRLVAEVSDVYRGRNEYVFVSYARVDQELVSPIVELIRSLGSRVFMDVNSIVPGSKWRPTLTAALSDANVVLVFWCEHSASSREVEKEYTEAHAANKVVIPILLDTTRVRAPLSDYQWVDFTGTFASHDPSNTRERFAQDQREFEEWQRNFRPEPGVQYMLPSPPRLRDFQSKDLSAANDAILRAIVAGIESRDRGGSS